MSNPLLSDEFLAPERSTTLATRSLIFAFIGFILFPFGLAAIIIGVMAFRNAGREPHLFGGRTRSLIAIVIGCASTLSCSPLSCGILLPAISRAREYAQHTLSANQMKQIAAALNAYAQQHGTYPAPAINLESTLAPAASATTLNYLSPFGGTRPDHSSYLYTAPTPRPGPGDPPIILLIENPILSRLTINVIDTTGTVTMLKHEEARQRLAGTPTLWTTKGKRLETADIFNRAAQ